ncbi:PQQ-binding-like beta-propeller repeat protein [Amycolatopsis sp. H20-H5]|nr:PQQ-binding-like beta-propeller repeat protein [Amycolatopsis sp. H20-H5]
MDGPRTGKLRWRRTLEGAATAGPVTAADGTIYASSNAGILHALDPATGADRWTFDTGGPSGGDLSVSPLVLPDGIILVPTSGALVALSPTGARLWSHDLPGRPTSPISQDGKRVYVGDQSGTVSALDVSGQGHQAVWTLDTGNVSYGSVVTDGTGRLYTTADSALVAIDDRGSAGAVAWRAEPADDIVEVSAGLAPDGTVLLGTNGGREWAYHRDGTPAWQAPRIITYSSPSVTSTGLAYVADHAGLVHVYDVRTGAEAATYGPIGAQIWSSTVVDRTYHAYLAGQNGHVHGFDARGGPLFDVDLGAPVDSYPALTGDGALIVGARNGVLAAIG